MRSSSTTFSIPLLAGLIASLACSPAGATPTQDLATDEQKEAYSLGSAMAMQARAGLGDIDEAAFVAGVSDVMTDAEASLSPAEIEASLARFDEGRERQAREEFAARAELNRSEGDQYRSRFAAEEGVVALDNGLLYKVLDEGEGKQPNEDSVVTVHYRAKLVDGREFDSTYTRGDPVSFPLEGVVQGFSEALTRMPEGSKWQIVMPPELAYGEQGAGPIGPNATLIFEMELISAG
jgi:FKBP-type peptidyl-prolyl cis-trans isomerase FklB